MISRRRLGLTSFAAAGLAACGKPALLGAPSEVTFSILPTAPQAALLKTWRPVLDDMTRATDLQVRPYIAPNDTALIDAMKFKQTDAGWFSNELGLEAVRRANAEVFARTLGLGGADGYKSVLIVNAKSGVTIDRIRKCDHKLSFGQSDPVSTSGYAAPIAFFFGENDIQPEKCFASVRIGSHAANLAAVASGKLDVATGSTITLALNREAGRREADAVKVIWSSPTLPEDPIIWRKDLDPAVKEKLRQFFLTYARGDTPEAERQRQNLKPLGIGGFEAADDNHLLMAREVEARVTYALARWSGDAARTGAAKSALDTIVAQRQAFEDRIRAQAGTQ